MRWTDEEEEYLKSGLSDEELSRKMNRTIRAIQEKRWRMGVKKNEMMFAPPYMSRIEKEARIYKLAKYYKVRIK